MTAVLQSLQKPAKIKLSNIFNKEELMTPGTSRKYSFDVSDMTRGEIVAVLNRDHSKLEVDVKSGGHIMTAFEAYEKSKTQLGL